MEHLILYHVTPSSNVSSIYEEGLLPVKKLGLTNRSTITRESWRKKVVWLTTDPTCIVETQGGSHWIASKDPIVLEVDVSGLEVVQRDIGGWMNYDGDLMEYLYFGSIPPERIKSSSPYVPSGKEVF